MKSLTDSLFSPPLSRYSIALGFPFNGSRVNLDDFELVETRSFSTGTS